MAWNTVISVLLNGLGHMQGQATYGTAFALLSLLLGYYIPAWGSLELAIWSILITGVVSRSIAMAAEARWVFRTRSV